jgi:wyosine [tRNA(Phe)-imidazoG37] synthetase (radical SAM superfamily)
LINRPLEGIKFEAVLEGIKTFKKQFRGRLALQMTFLKENAPHAREMARLAETIHPDQIQLNTPLRPCGVAPLGKPEILQIEDCFTGLPVLSVYESLKTSVEAISDQDTLRRRGKYKV